MSLWSALRRLFAPGVSPGEPAAEPPPAPDPGGWASERERLVPLLRTSGHAPGTSAAAGALLRRPFLPFLIECVGIDAKPSLELVGSSRLGAWKVTAEAVFGAAHVNASGTLLEAENKIHDDSVPYPLWQVAGDDPNQSARLLVPGWLASFAGKVKGRPVAIVPHRSFVLVGGDGDEACLRRLIESARREYEASSRAISPALYTVDAGGAVVPLVLPGDHPLAPQVAIGHVLLASSEYGAQRGVLQRQQGDQVFVSSYVAIQRKDGSVSSYTTWTKGVPSLLPEALEIAFVTDPGQPSSRVYRVPWQLAVARLGDLLVPEPGVDPPCFRTRDWPDEELLASLATERS